MLPSSCRRLSPASRPATCHSDLRLRSSTSVACTFTSPHRRDSDLPPLSHWRRLHLHVTLQAPATSTLLSITPSRSRIPTYSNNILAIFCC